MKQLYTCWASQLNNEYFKEYPRPMLRRDSFINLNGLWEYAIQKEDSISSVTWQGTILVPFALESALSKVQRQLKPDEYLLYKKTFKNPLVENSSILLHFDGVDYECKVYLNNQCIFEHKGGYIPFEMDITSYLKEENELIVVVHDETDASYHNRGKQTLVPKGMFYTSTSGIWKSVWMEVVPKEYIEDVSCQIDYDQKVVTISVNRKDEGFYTLEIYQPFIDTLTLAHSQDCRDIQFDTDTKEYEKQSILKSIQTDKDKVEIHFNTIQSWSPETPYLYYFKVHTKRDEVISYFAFRTFTVEKENEHPRICLNHKPIFQKGVLDQGYWPESGLTPPCDQALLYDIIKMKEMGFNMIRKHIKVELPRFYYHCDRIGMMVWQDMVCGGSKYKLWFLAYVTTFFIQFHPPFSDRHSWLLGRQDEQGKKEFEQEMEETIAYLKGYPCISTWVLFNEGWGQFDTKRLTDKMRKLDSSRIIDATSGWYDQKVGDLRSHHHYYFRLNFIWEKERATVLSEFGGIPYIVKDHIPCENVYGYHEVNSIEQLHDNYDKLIHSLDEAMKKGLSATVYTQVSDVEEEVNGILTYDREICKFEQM